MDTTLVSPLTSTGEPGRQGRHPGSPALRAARQAKERTYPELVRGDRCRLVVLAMEVGGRWSEEAADFLRRLAQARSRAVPQALRPAAIQASIARWSALRTQAAQAPFAASLTMQDPATHTGPDGEAIPLSILLQHCPPTPRPRHPASLYDLEGAPLALDFCQNPSGPAGSCACDSGPPLQTFMRQKGACGRKKQIKIISRCWQKNHCHKKKFTEILKEIPPRDPVERCMGILPVDPIYKASLDGVKKDFMIFFGRALAGIYF